MISRLSRYFRLLLLAPVLVLASGPASAADTEFKSIFDGETLEGWSAPDMGYWSVEEGAITGRGTNDKPVQTNQFLVWTGGELDDFELRLKYRLVGEPSANSGIQFRSRTNAEGHAIGYQADIDRAGQYCGALYDEHGRGMLAPRGRSVRIAPDGKRTETPAGDPDALWKAIRLDDWNDYSITAVGNHITLRLNGLVSAEVVDDETGQRDLAGLLALQIHAGPPLTVQFKDICLRRLPLADGRKKVVLVAGPDSHGYDSHAHGAGCRYLADCLNRAEVGIQATVYVGAWPTDPTAFDNADAVVVFSDGGPANVLKAEQYAEFDAVMRRGVGAGFLHYALVPPSQEQWGYMLDWIGGYFETDWSVNPWWVAEFQAPPAHPAARGLAPFTINDEWYYHMRFRDGMQGVTPILTAIPPDATHQMQDGAFSGNPHVYARMGMPEHVAWVCERPNGRGRGFGLTGAHMHWNWAHDGFRRTALNAIVWIAGAEVPEGGVVSPTPTLEELQAYLPGDAPPDWDREEVRKLLESWR